MDAHDERGYVSQAVFAKLYERIQNDPAAADAEVALVGDLIRFNTLLSVARAGTGHLGTSLSMADLMAELYFRRGQFSPADGPSPERDTFLLSKGHAAPGQYATLAARGYLANEELDRLRRWDGLPGHSHVCVPGIDGNTGSLAMGMSKSIGYAMAKARFGHGGHSYCICGDGELQEGQAWEALLSAASFGLANFTLIVDCNKVQTDQFVHDVLVYRDLPGSIRALGFAVVECDGHDAASIRRALAELDLVADRPKCLFANTIKGRGVGYMEHTQVLSKPGARYVWHNRSPNTAQLHEALTEIATRCAPGLARCGIATTEVPEHRVPLEPASTGIQGKPLIPAFAAGLLELARANDKVVVLDADLEEDCGLSPFRAEFPTRFFELGIMEQHMCSAASSLSALGYLPIINSYTAFLSSRSNEQIYNLVTDPNAKFLLVGHLAGVIPATPGMSHQAFRDVGCLRSIPGLVLYQPMSPDDCRNALHRYGNGDFGQAAYLRVVMAPSAVDLPTVDPTLPVGQSQVLRAGGDVVLISGGPVMLGEAMAAAESLAAEGIDVEVRNHPWPTAFAADMLAGLATSDRPVVVAEDHFRLGGLGEGLWAALAETGCAVTTAHVALKELPDTGFRSEALAGMGIDRTAIAAAVRDALQRRTHGSIEPSTAKHAA